MSFPDLTGDGKVTKKDILKGRGVEGFKKGGKVKMMRGGEVKFGHGGKVHGCNPSVQLSGMKEAKVV
jgi:hypothetical protein